MTRSKQPVVTLFMSISLNGLIARSDGREDFLTDTNWHAFVDLAKVAGALAWGRRTHEMFGPAAVAAMPGVSGFVLTSDRGFQVEKNWHLARSPEEAITLAAQAGAPELLVVGGATVNTAFGRQGLIDRVVLDIESVIIGEGIPLFARAAFDLPLQLRDIKTLSSTVIQLHYEVLQARSPRR